MSSRQRAWPRQWLMTDERIGARLWEAIDRLPAGESGIVFRHYRTPPDARAELARQVAAVCQRRRITLAVASDVELARACGADLVHNPAAPSDLPFSRAVHSIAEAEAAAPAGASLVFVSPIQPTRSHPDRLALDRAEAVRIAQAAGVPAIALGGMDADKFARLDLDGFIGWAGIDAWLEPA